MFESKVHPIVIASEQHEEGESSIALVRIQNAIGLEREEQNRPKTKAPPLIQVDKRKQQGIDTTQRHQHPKRRFRG
jgi:hypothetical protein